MSQNTQHTIGTNIWAYAFKMCTDKESKLNFQKPIYGQFAYSVYQESNEHALENKPYETPNYFIPFKKNSTELAYSKAVRYISREYAKTEQEAIIKFNTRIAEAIMWHEKEIEKLQNLKI